MNETDTAPVAPARAVDPRPPQRVMLTMLHLAAYGLFGFAVIGALVGAIGAGIGLLFVLGVGLVVFVGLVYALFGIAWFEVERVAGLYRLPGVAPLRRRPRVLPGFKGWLRALGRQSISGRMWAALASFAVASILGAATLALAQSFMSSLFLLADATAWWLGIVGVIATPAGIWGLALLHRAITVPIILAGAREEELVAQVAAQSQQREGAVRAADVERTRIERDLHDGVQPRLVSVAMTLGLAKEKIDSDPEAAKELVAEAHTSTKAAITELRQLARGIYASVLDDRGLDAALSALAARSHIPVHLDVRLRIACRATPRPPCTSRSPSRSRMRPSTPARASAGSPCGSATMLRRPTQAPCSGRGSKTTAQAARASCPEVGSTAS